MRRIVPLVFALVLLMGVSIWAGCSVGGTSGATMATETGQTETQSTPEWAEKFSSAPTLEQLGVQPYPASEIDESKTVVKWESGSKEETFGYHASVCPVANVAAFFRDTLKGMQDLEEQEGNGVITFNFKTADGVPMAIVIMAKNPSQPNEPPSDITIYVNP